MKLPLIFQIHSLSSNKRDDIQSLKVSIQDANTRALINSEARYLTIL